MFKKKKPGTSQSNEIQKAGPFKRAERRFFHFFNDKGRKRRVILMGVLAYFPAATMADMQKEDPSTQRGANGAAQVEQYRGDFGRIARGTNTITISSDGTVVRTDSARALQLEAQAMELAARLVNDTNISERDAQMLARQFLRDINDPAISRELRQIFGTIGNSSAFLNEARAEIRNNPALSGDQGERANQVIAKAASLSAEDNDLFRYFFNYLIFFMVFQSGAEALLRRGSRRDDKLKGEARVEILSDKIAELKASLTPKGQAEAAPAPATPAEKKASAPKRKR